MTKTLTRLAGILACAASLAAAGCASNASLPSSTQPQAQAAFTGPDWISEHGVIYHRPHYMGTRYVQHGQARPDLQLVYSGGPVLTNPQMYLIFWGWGTSDPNGVKPLILQYAQSIGGSAYNNIYTQYYGPSGHITNPSAQYAGAYYDNTNAVPKHPTDAQIAAEAKYVVGKVGYNANWSYVVLTPHGKSTRGFATQWCAYHSSTVYNNQIVSYTDLPYMPDGGSSCGANIISPPSDESGADEGETIVEGHEYGESVTDPNPPSGWYNNSKGEIGDICAWTNIANDPYGSNSYTAQPMFSNASSSCVHHYP